MCFFFRSICFFSQLISVSKCPSRQHPKTPGEGGGVVPDTNIVGKTRTEPRRTPQRTVVLGGRTSPKWPSRLDSAHLFKHISSGAKRGRRNGRSPLIRRTPALAGEQGVRGPECIVPRCWQEPLLRFPLAPPIPPPRLHHAVPSNGRERTKTSNKHSKTAPFSSGLPL